MNNPCPAVSGHHGGGVLLDAPNPAFQTNADRAVPRQNDDVQFGYRPSPRQRPSITKCGAIGVYQFDLKMAVVAINLHLVAKVSDVSKFQMRDQPTCAV